MIIYLQINVWSNVMESQLWLKPSCSWIFPTTEITDAYGDTVSVRKDFNRIFSFRKWPILLIHLHDLEFELYKAGLLISSTKTHYPTFSKSRPSTSWLTKNSGTTNAKYDCLSVAEHSRYLITTRTFYIHEIRIWWLN